MVEMHMYDILYIILKKWKLIKNCQSTYGAGFAIIQKKTKILYGLSLESSIFSE